MGIFNFIGKRIKADQTATASGKSDETVTIEIEATRPELEKLAAAISLVEAFDGEQADEDERRILEELAEQQERRKLALADRGVDVDAVTIEKCRGDLLDIASSLCGLDLEALGACERESIDWKQLTSTGKVPKCVATFNTHWYTGVRYGCGCNPITCEVSYLADGTPYAAWVSDLRGGTYYKIKTVDGELALIAANPV